MPVPSQKRRPINADFIRGNRYTPAVASQEIMGDGAVLSHCPLLINPWQNRPVCWSIVVKEKPTIGSPYFGAFPSDSIPKVTKVVKDKLWDRNFPHAAVPVKIYPQIPENFRCYSVGYKADWQLVTDVSEGLVLTLRVTQWDTWKSQRRKLITWISVIRIWANVSILSTVHPRTDHEGPEGE